MRPHWSATIDPHASSCTASMAATPNRVARTRSKAVGALKLVDPELYDVAQVFFE